MKTDGTENLLGGGVCDGGCDRHRIDACRVSLPALGDHRNALGDVVISSDDVVRLYDAGRECRRNPISWSPGSNRGTAFDGALNLFVTNTN